MIQRKSIGDTLEAIRRHRGLTLKKATEVTGISYRRLSEIECRGSTKLATLQRIADAYMVTLTFGTAGWSWKPRK